MNNARNYNWNSCVNMCRKALNLAINDLDTALKKNDYAEARHIEYQIKNSILCDVVGFDADYVIRTGRNLDKIKEERRREKARLYQRNKTSGK